MLIRISSLVLAFAIISHNGWLEGRERGMWTWGSEPILADPKQGQAFLAFCAQHRISATAMQIHVREGTLLHAAAWSALLAKAHQQGLQIHALDGDPESARPDQHETVLSRVEAVIAYNARAGSAERFDGIHMDIEPYLLPEWQDPARREQLLADYLSVHDRAAARAHAAGLAYGVDVPFWFATIDEASGRAVGDVMYRGERRPASEHLLAMVDNVVIMAYRDRAEGPNGIIAVSQAAVESATRIGRARVVIGIETEAVSAGVPPEVTFAMRSVEEMHEEIQRISAAYGKHDAFAGVAIHHYVSFRNLSER